MAAVVFHQLSPTMLVGSRYEVEELTLSACGQSTWLVGLFFSYSEWILLYFIEGDGIWMRLQVIFRAWRFKIQCWDVAGAHCSIFYLFVFFYLPLCKISLLCSGIYCIWFHHPYKNHMERYHKKSELSWNQKHLSIKNWMGPYQWPLRKLLELWDTLV